MYRHPSLVLLAFLIAGLITGRGVILPAEFIFLALFILIFFYAYVLHVQPRIEKKRQRHRPRTSGALLFFGIVLAGIFLQNRIVLEERHADAVMNHIEDTGYVNIEGYVFGLPHYRERSILVTLDRVKIDSDDSPISFPGKIQVVVCGKAIESLKEGTFTWGDKATVTGELSRPVFLRNPMLFNYAAYLKNKGIFGTVLVYADENISLSPPGDKRSLLGRWLLLIGKIRLFAREQITAYFSAENAPIVHAVLLGKSHSMKPELREKFVDAGLMHLFAVSGLHTGLLALVLFLALITATGNLRLSIIITVFGLVFYAALVGFRTPVVRAVIMANVYLLSILILRRPVRGLDVIATTAFFVLPLISPCSVSSLSRLFLKHSFILNRALSNGGILHTISTPMWEVRSKRLSQSSLCCFHL